MKLLKHTTPEEGIVRASVRFQAFETSLLSGRTSPATDYQTVSASMHPGFGSPDQSSTTDEQRRALRSDDFPGELPGHGSPRICFDVFSACLNTFLGLILVVISSHIPAEHGRVLPRDLIPGSRMLVFISSEP